MTLVAERSRELGLGLVVSSALAVLVSYPPPAIGGGLVGWFGMFVPLAVSVVALLLAVVGGVLVSQRFASSSEETSRRLAISALFPAGAVALVGAYLATIAGFDPGAPLFVIGLVVVGVVGVAVSLAN